jgi:hypothetical protein
MGGVLHGYSITDSPGTGADAAHNKTRKKKKTIIFNNSPAGVFFFPKRLKLILLSKP